MYDLCKRYQGRVVRITCRDGNVYHGKIVNVSRTHVFLEPAIPNIGGFGYGFYGGWGYRPIAIPLAFITGLVLGGLFWF